MRRRVRRGPVRERLSKAILELVSERGVAGLGMSQVARRAGCANSAPYKSWSSIEVAIAEVAAGESTVLASRARRAASSVEEGDAVERVMAAIGSVVTDALTRPGSALLVQAGHSFVGPTDSGAPASVRTDILGELFRDLGLTIARDAGRPEVGHLFAWAVAAMASGVLNETVRQRAQFSHSELMERARAAMAGLMVGMLGRLRS